MGEIILATPIKDGTVPRSFNDWRAMMLEHLAQMQNHIIYGLFWFQLVWLVTVVVTAGFGAVPLVPYWDNLRDRIHLERPDGELISLFPKHMLGVYKVATFISPLVIIAFELWLASAKRQRRRKLGIA